MRSEFGKRLRVEIFGESHGPHIGGRVLGLPRGIRLDECALAKHMHRRQGGNAPYTTPRREKDMPIFQSGLTDGVTDGGPLAFIIPNENVRKSDYVGLRTTPRPSHADYTAPLRFGEDIDLSGGGHFSGRLTAPLCVAGWFALELLQQWGITVGAHLLQVGPIRDTGYNRTSLSKSDLLSVKGKSFPTVDDAAGEKMQKEICTAAAELDSVGGLIECGIVGLPAGIGNPLYDGVENRLSAALFGLGGVRGVEFGTGFAAAAMRGSQHNDPFRMEGDRVVTATNHAGGILGGITTGMPLLFTLCMKPTASIAKEQQTVDLVKKENTTLVLHGRHDPCIAVRAVPCVESLAALALLDLICERNEYGSPRSQN